MVAKPTLEMVGTAVVAFVVWKLVRWSTSGSRHEAPNGERQNPFVVFATGSDKDGRPQQTWRRILQGGDSEMASGGNYIDTQIVGKLENFNDSPEKWGEWSFKAWAWFGLLDVGQGGVDAKTDTAEARPGVRARLGGVVRVDARWHPRAGLGAAHVGAVRPRAVRLGDDGREVGGAVGREGRRHDAGRQSC